MFAITRVRARARARRGAYCVAAQENSARRSSPLFDRAASALESAFVPSPNFIGHF